jgi:acyl-CoA thioesterase-1
MRRIISLFILAGVAAGVAACKADPASRASSEIDKSVTPAVAGSMSDPSTTTTPPRAVEARGGADARPLIVCFGDSLTAGYGADEGESYPDFLQKDLDAEGYHYRVVNEGISGNTTKDGLDRLAGVVAMKPAVVVLEFGGNDGLRGFKTQITKNNLGTMIAALKKGGAKVVLAGITLPPDYGPDYVKAFTENYAQLGRQYEVPVLPFLLQDVYGVPGMMQADGIHATDQGNEVVAKNVVGLVEPLLKR